MSQSTSTTVVPDPAGGHIDSAEYREVMGHYPTGVAVVTGLGEQREPIGMVVGTFTAVSMDPPLVAFMPTITSGTYALMRAAGAFCINVLAHDQLDLCRLMAVPRPGKFDDVAWTPAGNGAPLLDEAVAHIECRVQEEVVAGDHYIVLCSVERMRVTRPVTPLLFFQGGYGGFNPRGMAAHADSDLIAAVRLAEVARAEAERIAKLIGCEAGVLVGVNDHEVTTAFTAFEGTAEMDEALGERILLMPPLGEGYVAWRPQREIDEWLARTSSPDAEVTDKYRRRIAAVQEKGYALSVLEPDSPHDYDDLKQAMREYAHGELTPAQERRVRSVIAAMSAFFESLDIDPDARYDLGSIVVPVLGPEGHTVLALRLRQLPLGVGGEQVNEWITALKAAARRVEAKLIGSSAEDYERYRDAYPSGEYMM